MLYEVLSHFDNGVFDAFALLQGLILEMAATQLTHLLVQCLSLRNLHLVNAIRMVVTMLPSYSG